MTIAEQIHLAQALEKARLWNPEVPFKPSHHHSGKFDFGLELNKYLGGIHTDYKDALPFPFFQPISHQDFLNKIASGGSWFIPKFGRARLHGETGYTSWTMFYINVTQGSELDGTGILVRYDTKRPLTGRFAICQHKIVLDVGADPSHGWRPGRCEHCNLDMTVDSGD